jgi:hypothetical protein
VARSGLAAAARRLSEVDRGLAAVVTAFVLSRVIYHALGVKFDATPLGSFWQFIDPALLRDRLLESLWYAHAQPPLFNLFLGVVLKVFGNAYAGAFKAIYFGLGLALAVLLYRLMRRLGTSALLGAGLTIVYTVGPAAILYENWLYVEQLVTVCLLGGAVLLHRFAERGRTRDAAAAFALMGVIVLSRPFFHLVWLLGLVVVACLAQPARRRQILAAAALPVALTIGLYTKNFVMYDVVGSTSCPGLTVSRVTTFQLTENEIRRKVRAGELSRFALETPFGLANTRPELFRNEPRRGVRLLDATHKSTGAPSLDHAAFLRICPHYLQDAKKVFRDDPDTFKRAVQESAFIYLRPPSQYTYLDKNRVKLAGIDRAYGLLFYGQIRPATDYRVLDSVPRGDYRVSQRIGQVAWLALGAYLAATGLALLCVWRAVRARKPSTLALVAAYLVFNIAWVTLVSLVLGAGENNRFRYQTDPLVLALVAVLAGRLTAAVRSALSPTSGAR